MASSSSTPSSTNTLPKKYDVFLSFRAPDTRVGFTSHLNHALGRKYMVTFIDYKLARGDEISPALLKSIQESKIAVVIFSKDYASSKWCLRELVEIMKCKKLHELIVLPVFYNVDPSDVRKQTGPFKDSFAKHENESQDEVQEWREAFTEASNLAGWDYARTWSESELICDIVEDVQSKLMSEIENISPPLNDFECLIGIDKRIEQVISLLCLDTMDVRIIGVWGMGGIGKTTLATAVFNRIYGQFDGSSFIEKVGKRLKEPGTLDSLVHEILSKLLDEQNLKLATPTILHPFIKERLNRKKVLIVLDDVNNFLQLETLVEVLNGSGLGSRMIMTSRDKQVLDNFVDDHDHIYEVDGLDHDEALELFCKYAFKKKHPTEGFMNLSEWMVSYTKGNPLALKVLGSHLLRRNKQEWESVFDDLQGIGDSDIFNVLKISYDGLNDKEKNLFLDIACFFNGYFEDNIAKLLDCEYSLRVLINKSLITTEEGRIKMHDLLKEMGWEIVRRESAKNPGKSSRLWKLDDAIRTWKNNSGAEEVEGISLYMDNLKDAHLNLSSQVFNQMQNLRYLLRTLPSDFSLQKLVKLELSRCNIEQLWEGTMLAPKLKRLNLRYCQHLIRIPNLSGFLSFEDVDRMGCKRLVEFHSSVQQPNKLRYLSLGGCSYVTKFPPTSTSIKRLNLSGTAIEESPSSIQSLTNLTELDLSNCTRLKHISASICKLKLLSTLDLTDCSKLKIFPEILETMESLKARKLSTFSVIRPDSKIVETVCTELRSKYIPSPSDFEGLIGIHKRIEHVKSLLCLDMKDVRKIIGIWGMGGVGKTTIARAVFKSISYQFDGACFIEKVGKRLENGGSDRLQLEVLSEVLHEENLKLGSPTIRPFIMELLNQKKVFIVLDDVNNFLQLETLAQGLDRCGLGSRIIITSRDKQVLSDFNIDGHEIYEAEGFNDDEALEVFHKHANPTKDCMALSKKIVNYAKGNPLALEVLGSSLKGKSKQVWESALNNLQGIVNPKNFDVLKINYDGLNEEEKKLFLDLACFGDLYNYHGLLKEEFLDCTCLEYSLSVLIAKSLITRHIRTGDIEMHDLLQEMGRKIVCGEPPKEPGMRSRLWEQKDVIWTLEKNTGTNAVEGISLDMDGLEDIHLSSQVFDKMHNLRFLIFHSMYGSDKVLHLPNDLNCLPDELMFLHWLGYPLRALPSNFNPKELVKLDLSGSNIKQLWDVTKCAPKLKWLILSYCEHLTRIPNLSDFPLLVEVDLSHCESLADFPSSDQQHNYLRNLNMSETAIKEVPSSIQSLTNLTELKLAECTRLKHISTSICKLKSLSTLDLTDCSKLENFPEILETMESLKALKLSAFFNIDMDLKVLPPSIERLNGLRSLTLNGCKNLEMLPSSICNLTSLEDLHLSYCSKRVKLPDNLENLKSLKRLTVTGSAVGQLPSSITCLVNLEDLDCSGCSLMKIPEDIDCLSSLKKLKLSRNVFESLPKSIKQLSKLEFLSLSHCNMLRSLPEFPEGLECLEAMDCDQLCQVPDASEFVRCINSKSHFANYHHHHHVDFIFTNSLNLIKAVSNVFEESLRIMQRTEKGSGKPPNEFSIYLPGNKIPKWFYNQSHDHGICNKIHYESSINIKVPRNDLVNRKFMGFAIWAVFGCDENNTRVRFTHGVGCVFETYYDRIEICNGNRIYRTHYGSDLPSIFIDSDHMLLGYCSFYSRNPMKPPADDSDRVDISIEFKIHDNGNQLKCWAVRPIYAVQEIGETSGRRSDRSDDNDEEVEPHPKRICTQEI